MLTTVQGLRFRRTETDLFALGDYLPIDTSGEKRDFLCVFARKHGNSWVVAAVPRFVTRLVHAGQFPLGEEVWGDTVLVLPAGAPEEWLDVITGQKVRARQAGDNRVIDASHAFAHLPVVLLTSRAGGSSA